MDFERVEVSGREVLEVVGDDQSGLGLDCGRQDVPVLGIGQVEVLDELRVDLRSPFGKGSLDIGPLTSA